MRTLSLSAKPENWKNDRSAAEVLGVALVENKAKEIIRSWLLVSCKFNLKVLKREVD